MIAEKKYTALMYTLLHETSHQVDYVSRKTPFPEPDFAEVQELTGQKTPFVNGVWDGYETIVKKYNVLESKDLHAYGLSVPVIDSSQIPSLYERLSKSPIVSAYAAKSWAEDYADSISFYYLTNTLKQPYTVTIIKNKKAIAVYSPTESVLFQKHIGAVKEVFE